MSYRFGPHKRLSEALFFWIIYMNFSLQIKKHEVTIVEMRVKIPQCHSYHFIPNFCSQAYIAPL